MTPKILLTGKTGQIGSELLRLLPGLGEVTAPGRQDLNLLDSGNIRSVVRNLRPNLIVNAAAYTAVDAAETESKAAYAINADAPAILAEEASRAGAALVHYSTDYVFDGLKSAPYEETDAPGPINAYGKSKLAGEQAIQTSGVPHLILRTAWVYSTRGKNFLLTILRLATEREELRVVEDQWGSPTWSREIANATARILTQVFRLGSAASYFAEAGGTYHLTAAGKTTWYGFAKAILEAAPHVRQDDPLLSAATGGKPFIVRRIVPIMSAEYPTPARRPANSVISNARFIREFGFALPDWSVQLERCLGVTSALQET